MVVMISGKSAGGAVEVDLSRFRVNGDMYTYTVYIYIYNIYIYKNNYIYIYICTKQPTKIGHILSDGWGLHLFDRLTY